jgi:hypothetical protein
MGTGVWRLQMSELPSQMKYDVILIATRGRPRLRPAVALSELVQRGNKKGNGGGNNENRNSLCVFLSRPTVDCLALTLRLFDSCLAKVLLASALFHQPSLSHSR